MRIAMYVAAALTPVLFAGGVRAAQHEGHQAGAPAAAAVAQCAQVQPAIAATLDAAGARLEAARQTNSPAAMRAAIDDLQGALRDVRLRLAPCAALSVAPAADPHAASHTMPAAPATEKR